MIILGLVSKGVNPKVLKNAMTFWFHNWLNCFKPYMVLKGLNKKSALTNQKSFILSDIFIKIGSSLSLIKLFKYALIISICFIKNSKSADITKKILSDFQHTIKANVLLKSLFGIWKYLWATNFASYLATDLLGWYFILKTH